MSSARCGARPAPSPVGLRRWIRPMIGHRQGDRQGDWVRVWVLYWHSNVQRTLPTDSRLHTVSCKWEKRCLVYHWRKCGMVTQQIHHPPTHPLTTTSTRCPYSAKRLAYMLQHYYQALLPLIYHDQLHAYHDPFPHHTPTTITYSPRPARAAPAPPADWRPPRRSPPLPRRHSHT